MGSSTSCDDSVSGSIDIAPCFYGLKYEESFLRHEKSSYGNSENVKKNSLDLDSFAREEDRNFDNLIIKEIGISLHDTLKIHDFPEALCFGNSVPCQESISNQLEGKPLSLDPDALESLNFNVDSICSEQVQAHLVNSDTGDALSCMNVQKEAVFEAENLASVQPLLTSTKLIPALKGSRVKHGIHLTTKLDVKWSPEVYDPPVTSSSNTMKGHQRHHHHHAKTKKEYYNHKHSKGKSSKTSFSERKHAHRKNSASNSVDPRVSRLQALGSSVPQPLRNGCGKVEPLDLAANSHEGIKYGSSYYTESHASVQLTVAKAS